MRIAFVTLLLLLLVACVGEDEAAGEQEAGLAEAEAAVEVDSNSEAVDESTAEEHESGGDDMAKATADDDDTGHEEGGADADEPHEMDEDAEADSDADEGLEAGHDEDSADDEATDDDALNEDAEHDGDADEDSAGGEVMAAAGDGWGESRTTAQTACDHPYMPLRQGANWTYDSGEGAYGWEVTDVQGDLEQATAVILVTIEDLTLEYTWECAAGEGISSFGFAGRGLAAAFPEMTMELTRGEGAFVPPADEMVPGYSWDTSFEQTMNFVIGEGDEQVEATGDISTEQTSTILSADPITAAEVTVDGVQVEQISDIAIVMNMMGSEVEQSQTLSSTFDMGWGVGIMRQAVQSEFGPAAVDLISFYVP